MASRSAAYRPWTNPLPAACTPEKKRTKFWACDLVPKPLHSYKTAGIFYLLIDSTTPNLAHGSKTARILSPTLWLRYLVYSRNSAVIVAQTVCKPLSRLSVLRYPFLFEQAYVNEQYCFHILTRGLRFTKLLYHFFLTLVNDRSWVSFIQKELSKFAGESYPHK